MLDTLILVASLAHPTIERPLKVVVLNETLNQIPALQVPNPVSLGTCHESSVDSCWTDK